MKKGKRKSDLTASSDVLESLLQGGGSGLAQHFSGWRLAQQWGEIVGPSIAQRSQVVGLQRDMLVVWVPNSVVLQEMNFVTESIKEKVNAHLGRKIVKHVRFTLEKRGLPFNYERKS